MTARLLATLLTGFLLAAAPASASTVRLGPGGAEALSSVTYTAAPGEQNKVSVAIDGGRATIHDPGASSITTQQGCTQLTPKHVVCDLQDSTATITAIIADLADGNDSFGMTAVNTPFGVAAVKGGDGNDDLRGTQFPDRLDGGVGKDALRGGGSDDFLRTEDTTGAADADLIDGGSGFDTFDGYRERTTPVTVDLATDHPAGEAGEGDSLTGIEWTAGGKADDTLRGTNSRVDSNWLDGGGGNDFIDGRAGRDVLNGEEGNDTVIGGGGRDEIDAGPGDDLITLGNERGEYDRYVRCQDGDDTVIGLIEALAPLRIDCERVDVGSGIVLPILPQRVTTTYVSMSIPCPAKFHDSNGVCAGKLAVEPRRAFRKSASTRFKERYGANEFRFKTQSAKITVPLNARGRKELRKPSFHLQFTLRLTHMGKKRVREFTWTENLVRFRLQEEGVG